MDKSILNHYFHSLFPIEEAIVNKITEKFEYFELAKSRNLIEDKSISTNTYFLEKGYMRAYIMSEEGEEVTTNIYSAPCFVNDFLSFFKQQPSKQNYQSLTSCELWATSLENVQSNFHNIPEFREFSRLLFVINYDKLQDRMIQMASQKAESRYLDLIKQTPEIFQHVPLKIIASYLGITDSSLSRIRKEISKL